MSTGDADQIVDIEVTGDAKNQICGFLAQVSRSENTLTGPKIWGSKRLKSP